MHRIKFGFLLTALLATTAWAQNSPVGVWQSTSDKDGKPEAHIEITEKNGQLRGRVLKSLRPETQPGEVCEQCTDDRKGQPMMGLEIIRGVSAQPQEGVWTGGKILDPRDGKEYRLSLTPKDGGQSLAVRGYLGPFFRTQSWIRVK